MTVLAVGILVGGEGSRLGGVAKGLLPTRRDVPIIEQLVTEIGRASPHATVYLLGSRPEYAHFGLTQIEDTPSGIGPLGGLSALLRTESDEVALLGCDMPYITAPLLRRLLSAPCATAVATKSGSHHFEPMFSRFNVRAALPVVEALIAQRRHSLQAVLVELAAEVLQLTPEEAAQLRDWDTPEDVASG